MAKNVEKGLQYLMDKFSRNLKFYDLVVTRRATQAPYPPLIELVDIWKAAIASGVYSGKEYENGSITSVISDVSIDQTTETATLLIELADRNAPNATYRDHNLRKGRHIEKEVSEGNGYSSHIAVSTRPESSRPNTYLCAIEVMPSVSAYRIRSVLNGAIKSACETNPGLFEFTKPGGTKKKTPFVPHIMLDGHPSEQFLHDIEHGRINGVQLVERSAAGLLGQNPYLESQESILKIKLSQSIPVGQRLVTLISNLGSKSHQYPTTRISLQPESGGNSFQVEIETSTGNLISEAYVKSKKLNFPTQPLLVTSPDTIVTHLAEAMKDVIGKARK